MSRTIELLISPQGETTIRTQGFVGSSCQEASRFLETALGERLRESKTAEFYASAETHQQVQQ